MIKKVYHRKNHQVRGNKICEIDTSINSCGDINEIKKHTTLMDKSLMLRFWTIENETFIDYGSHSALIVIKECNK